MVSSFRELHVWRRGVELSLALYKLTQQFPIEERFGLTSQLRRAGVSVPSNIAEGYGRGTRGEYKQFLATARGSTLEVQTQLVIARQLGYGEEKLLRHAEDLSEQVSKMLYSVIQKL